MPYLLLAIGLLIGAFALYRFFLSASLKEIGALFLVMGTGIIAIALFVLALTGRLPAAIAIVAACWPFAVAYWRQKKRKSAESSSFDGNMSAEEALEILGLSEDANAQDIKDAHKSLMKKVHPDQQGTEGLAKRLNMAKDLLLKDKTP